MGRDERRSTGIEGLDKIIDYLRVGDTVTWQIDDLADYMYVANRFSMNIARDGKRIVYIRFGTHQEIIDAKGLVASGANVEKYVIDPHMGFETFAVQLHKIISKEGEGVFYIFDCLSDLQKYWFSDLMVGNLFCLTTPFISEQKSIAYMPIMYERHTYETISRIRHAVPVLANMRTFNGELYILPLKVNKRYTKRMYFPLKLHGDGYETITSSAKSYAIFDKFTQTGEQRDCWDRMFDNFEAGSEDVLDEDGVPLRENILQCLLGTEPTRLELCRKYFSTEDLVDIKRREIGTGCIGGKAVGMLLARNILRNTQPELYKEKIEPHDSYFIGADVFYTYAVQNDTWGLRVKMVKDEDYLRIAPELREKLYNGRFTKNIREQFISMLEYFGQSPIIVRSSSLLEDGFGNAFAGKYESIFCPNQGTIEERYAVFEQAVRTVYASTLNSDTIKYRTDRNLLNRDEQMALLVMRVSGDCHGRYYYPHLAGVGHSKNLYVCGSGNTENKGMLRLVFGMGTRAVEREADDYARLLNMADPTAPQLVAHGDEYRYSQHKVDVIDLEDNRFRTIRAEYIEKEDIHADAGLFMEKDMATMTRLKEAGITGRRIPDIINFNKLLRKTDFADTMTTITQTIAQNYHYPVDIEFACNFYEDDAYRVNLLQCRPLQTRGIDVTGASAMPEVKDYLFKIKGNFMGGNVSMPVKYVVFVNVSNYLALSEQRKYQAARAIGKLNAVMKGKDAVLIGPGRWGTTTPSLGVPVGFMEISNFVSISEVSYNAKGLRPELSYGSHFFQDLVEAGTFYTALYQDECGCTFREDLFGTMENHYNEFLGLDDRDNLDNVIGVYDVSDKDAVLYAEIESQECFLGFKKV